jgi:hypothetical protein
MARPAGCPTRPWDPSAPLRAVAPGPRAGARRAAAPPRPAAAPPRPAAAPPSWNPPGEHTAGYAGARPSWNPQNTPPASPPPDPAASPEAAVGAQLGALRAPHAPWPNHGTQLMYEHAWDVGIDRSSYFGRPEDLYHQDHFMGKLANRLPELLGHGGYEVESVRAAGPGNADGVESIVAVRVASAGGLPHSRFEFHLARCRAGPERGAFVTARLLRLEGE